MKKIKQWYFFWKIQRRFNRIEKRQNESRNRKIVDWDELNKIRIM